MLSLERQNELREKYRAANPNWQPATEVYANLVRLYLQPDSRALDLGCGRGGLVEQLDHPLTQMVGVDPDWHSLRQHRLALPRAAAYSDRLPFAPASFDVVFASWVLEHLARPLATLRAVRRVLRPQGVFVFVTPNGRHPLTLLNRGLGRFSRLQGQIVSWFYDRAPDDTFPTFYRANSAAALAQLGQHSGLRLQTLHAIPDPTYLAFHPLLFRGMAWLEEQLPTSRKLHLVGVLTREN